MLRVARKLQKIEDKATEKKYKCESEDFALTHPPPGRATIKPETWSTSPPGALTKTDAPVVW